MLDARRTRWLVAVLVPVVGLLAYSSSGHDDSHITFFVARELARLGRIVNYNGQPIEQSSSLLFVLLLGALHRLTAVSLPTLGAAVSMLFGALTVLSAGRLARRVDLTLERPVVIALGLNPCLLFWSVSGMETTLAAWLLLSLVSTLHGYAVESGRLWPVLASTAGALLVRPEAAVVIPSTLVACAVLFHLTSERGAARRVAHIALASVIMVVALVVWRQMTFGMLFPLPVIAKIGPRKGTLVRGALYLLAGCGATTPLAALLALHLLRRAPFTPQRARRCCHWCMSSRRCNWRSSSAPAATGCWAAAFSSPRRRW